MVLVGTAAGLLLVILLGVLTFQAQVRLPHQPCLSSLACWIGLVLPRSPARRFTPWWSAGCPSTRSSKSRCPIGWVRGLASIQPGRPGVAVRGRRFVIGSYFLAERSQKASGNGQRPAPQRGVKIQRWQLCRR